MISNPSLDSSCDYFVCSSIYVRLALAEIDKNKYRGARNRLVLREMVCLIPLKLYNKDPFKLYFSIASIA